LGVFVLKSYPQLSDLSDNFFYFKKSRYKIERFFVGRTRQKTVERKGVSCDNLDRASGAQQVASALRASQLKGNS